MIELADPAEIEDEDLEDEEITEEEAAELEAGSAASKPSFPLVPKTTKEDRQWILEQVAEGTMKASECAAKFGVSISFISKLLRKAGITYGSRKKAREEAARQAQARKEAEVKASFAERRINLIEEHKNSAVAILRGAFVMEGIRQQKWREHVKTGGNPPSVKESSLSARTISTLDQRIRILLGMDEIVDEKQLPQIDIQYMGDDEIIAIRKGQNPEEDLQFEDEIAEEAGDT